MNHTGRERERGGGRERERGGREREREREGGGRERDRERERGGGGREREREGKMLKIMHIQYTSATWRLLSFLCCSFFLYPLLQ